MPNQQVLPDLPDVLGLPKDDWEGRLNHVHVRWNAIARERLTDDVIHHKISFYKAKAKTETIASQVGIKLKEPRVRILASFHETSTDAATGDKQPHPCHCTFESRPGQFKVHVYVTIDQGICVRDIQIIGISVMKYQIKEIDLQLSCGTYPLLTEPADHPEPASETPVVLSRLSCYLSGVLSARFSPAHRHGNRDNDRPRLRSLLQFASLSSLYHSSDKSDAPVKATQTHALQYPRIRTPVFPHLQILSAHSFPGPGSPDSHQACLSPMLRPL
ncbi:hypothetical protein BJY04DRAFT_213571 [Aspergillus karnatakaensis]|uniref:uncharacterized protein n=1 Tax=Aspergillus karnatakaensis TaxID=1810916 RepID=UPI003CCC9B9C